METVDTTNDSVPEGFFAGIQLPEGVKIEDASSLSAKTIFLKVRFGALGNSKKVSGSEVLTTDADHGFLKVSKTLMDSAELEAIKKADGKMRAWLFGNCLPYDIGVMLLPIGLIDKVQTRLLEYQKEREILVQEFVAVYPTLITSAAEKLGSLYRPDEYPAVESIKDRFGFSWNYISFGVPGKLMDLSPALFESEKAKLQQQMETASEEITALMRTTLLDMVTHLEDKLTPASDGAAKILRKTTVEKLQEFLDTFDLRNVTNDKELAQLVGKAKDLIAGRSADQIRSDDGLRETLRFGMENIKGALSEMVENKPGRLFRDF